MTTEQINRIVSLRKSGKGYDTIALETGISKSTISSFCKKNGLSGKASNKVEEIGGNSLLSSPSRGNVDAGKRPESSRKIKANRRFQGDGLLCRRAQRGRPCGGAPDPDKREVTKSEKSDLPLPCFHGRSG